VAGAVELPGLLLVGYGGIAQLVEHLLCKQGVTGSNPVASMSAAGVPDDRDEILACSS
jgi:hypothetical protein